MSPEPIAIEMLASSVEEAVQKGLDQLNLPADSVTVEVLDNGSRGLFGLGSRQARVRMTVKGVVAQAPVALAAQPKVEVEKGPAASTPVQAVVVEPEPEPVAVDETDYTPSEAEAVRVSKQVIADLLEKMKISATVTAVMRRASHEEDEDTVLVNIEGDDLSILIGRRSETLNALQYISSLIVGKQMDGWVPLMIDVQGYRARRDRQLRVLARRMAEQAVHSGRRQVLEPMPANERRVIHLELRDHPRVATESIGDEPNRKITIVLKK
jgi:spoIIIJ-associated protein